MTCPVFGVHYTVSGDAPLWPACFRGGSSQTGADRLGATGVAYRAGHRTESSSGVYVAGCGGECATVPGTASGRTGAGLCLLASQTRPAAPVGASDPKEEGALR